MDCQQVKQNITLSPSQSHMQKMDSLSQFNFLPVLGMNVLGNLVPIEGNVLLGPNLTKTGIFFASFRPDYCFFRKECFRQEQTKTLLVGYINNYKEHDETLTDLNGVVSHKRTSERIKKCGTVKDQLCKSLAITNCRSWWVGTTFYQPDVMVFPKLTVDSYPGTHTQTYCEITKPERDEARELKDRAEQYKNAKCETCRKEK